MKKLLFITPTLRSGGGVIRGLQNMLALFPRKKYHIDILPMGFSDSNNVELSNSVILSDNFWLTAITAVYKQTTNYRKRKKLLVVKLLLFLLKKLKCRDIFIDKVFQNVAKIYSGYDVVIAYQEGPCTHFSQYLNAPHKIAWVHCDYKNYQKFYSKSEEEIYSKFHHIVCVSRYTLLNFQQIYPSLEKRTLYIYNVLDKKFICKSSEEINEGINCNSNQLKLISVGRLDAVKQFHLIPSIIRKMLDLGATNFHWILLGSGIGTTELEKICTELKENKIDDKYFSYLGAKFNPYPYIKNSDILVSTSLSEACPFVVNEARVLGVPVVSNNYPSIYEFIEDGIDGRIIPINEIPNVLTELVLDNRKLEKIKIGMIERNYNNYEIMKEVIKLLDYEVHY